MLVGGVAAPLLCTTLYLALALRLRPHSQEGFPSVLSPETALFSTVHLSNGRMNVKLKAFVNRALSWFPKSPSPRVISGDALCPPG